MKKVNIFATTLLIAISTSGAFAQQIAGSSVFSPSAGGARILAAQGNTAADPAIGFQSSVSDPFTAQNDGGGGNGIFRPLANTMAFATASLERMRIDVSGNVSIGTATPLARLTVASVPAGLQTAISGKGISVGVFGEAFEMTAAALTQQGIDRGDVEAIGVFGKGTYTTHSGNGSVFGVAGSAVTANPLNNIGVLGEARNANGYNTAVIGLNESTVGIFNTGTSGYVALNPSGIWSRAIAGYAPVAPNHFAGYFEGNVDVQTGSVRVGNVTTPVGYKLYVEQGILTEKVKVAVASSPAWADYVFAADYKLKPLSEVEKFIDENNHLPNIPSAQELVNEGLDLGKMQALQMEKIEELTLYLIKIKKEIEVLKKENTILKSQITKN